MSPTADTAHDARRARVRRTVWVLVATALTAYSLLFVMAART